MKDISIYYEHKIERREATCAVTQTLVTSVYPDCQKHTQRQLLSQGNREGMSGKTEKEEKGKAGRK